MKAKKILLIIGVFLLALVVGVGGYGLYIYKSVQSTVDEKMLQPIDREKSEKRAEIVDIEKGEPLAFLLLGVDARNAERGRSDTLMVITVNPETDSMKMVSIPRDTYAEIVGRGFKDKINHAYAFGGPEMSIRTVENYLDIPIDYFATVNMRAFKEIVDAFGGVTVNNRMAFNYDGHQFGEGDLFLDGTAALAFSRMRYEDPRGDLGRNDRQRQVLNAIINEAAHLSSVTKVSDVITSLGNNVSTNVSFNEIMKIQNKYRSARHNIETLEFSGRGGGMQNGVWYLFVPEEERLAISTELRTHLGLEDPKLASNN